MTHITFNVLPPKLEFHVKKMDINKVLTDFFYYYFFYAEKEKKHW